MNSSDDRAKIPQGEPEGLGEPEQFAVAPPPPEEIAPKVERLALPKGALIAFRKSVGLKSASREIVIYPDGRVSYGGADLSKNAYERAARRMNDAQMANLRRLLDKVGFFRIESEEGEPQSKAVVYEIAARLGKRSNNVQVFGAMPGALEPLIEQLNRLMPAEEPTPAT
jgi:hypothetical protein